MQKYIILCLNIFAPIQGGPTASAIIYQQTKLQINWDKTVMQQNNLIKEKISHTKQEENLYSTSERKKKKNHTKLTEPKW